MESVSTTYSSRVEYRNLRDLTATTSAVDGNAAAQGVAATGVYDSANGKGAIGSGEQLGVQRSGGGNDEFHPYSAGTGNSGKNAADAIIPRSGGTSVDGTSDNAAAASRKSGGGSSGVRENTQDPRVQAEVAKLRSAEEKVKAHEAAHKSAGGTMTGPISYSYTRGPDGKQYITGGEVPITISGGRTPQETASKMQQVIRAALAPSDPSPQDRSVAAQAETQLQQAQQQSHQQSASSAIPSPTGAAGVKAPAEADTSVGKSDADNSLKSGETAVGGTEKSDSSRSAAAGAATTVASARNSAETAAPEKISSRNGSEKGLPSGVVADAFRRAYSDPAVTGNDAVPVQFTTQVDRGDTAARNTGALPAPPSMTPGQLTGFGAPRPLSYYA